MLRGEAMATQLAGKYLTFKLAEEEYGLQILKVKEIIGLTRITRVPRTPDFIRGVINLRGRVIPLLDVRSRFGLADAAYTDRTVVVVIELGDATTGLVVDAVSDVTDIPPEQIEPRTGARAGRAPMVRGLGKRADRVSFILDVPALLALDGATPATAVATPSLPPSIPSSTPAVAR